jgi:Cu-Zn family superoxide dismutase
MHHFPLLARLSGMRHSSRIVLAVSTCTLIVSGCTSATTGPVRNVQVNATFDTASGTATTYDTALVPVGAQGSVASTGADGSTTVTLDVRGLQPGRAYGAHAHTQDCGAKGVDAGPHFQNEPDPVSPSVDPAYANPRNEIWLDLTTDGAGAGSASATVPWEFSGDRRARSVIIHAMPTATDAGKAGTAGARAACVTVGF